MRAEPEKMESRGESLVALLGDERFKVDTNWRAVAELSLEDDLANRNFLGNIARAVSSPIRMVSRIVHMLDIPIVAEREI